MRGTRQVFTSGQNAGRYKPGSFERGFSLQFRFRFPLALVAALLLAVAFLVPAQAQENQESLQRSIDWLVDQQVEDGGFAGLSGESEPGVTVDAVLALAAAGAVGIEVEVQPALDYLAENALVYAQSGPGAAAKLALALLATGQDPHSFNTVDPLAIVEVSANQGMIGFGPFDHALGLLALAESGTEIPSAAIDAARASQAEDGAWAFDGTITAGAGDSNTTALMVQALVAAGLAGDEMVGRATDYLISLQSDSGAFAFQTGLPPDSNSTAFALQALVSVASPELDEARTAATEALLAFQNESGAFRYTDETPDDNLLSSVQAIPAVAGFALPVPALVPMATPAAGSPEATPLAA